MEADTTARLGELRTTCVLTLCVAAVTAALQLVHLFNLPADRTLAANFTRAFSIITLALLLLLETLILVGAFSLRIFGDARRSLRWHLMAAIGALVVLGGSWVLQDASDVAHLTSLGDAARTSGPANNKMQRTKHG